MVINEKQIQLTLIAKILIPGIAVDARSLKPSLAQYYMEPWLVERQNEVGFLENDVIRLKYQEATKRGKDCRKYFTLRYCLVIKGIWGTFLAILHFNDLNVSVSEHIT